MLEFFIIAKLLSQFDTWSKLSIMTSQKLMLKPITLLHMALNIVMSIINDPNRGTWDVIGFEKRMQRKNVMCFGTKELTTMLIILLNTALQNIIFMCSNLAIMPEILNFIMSYLFWKVKHCRITAAYEGALFRTWSHAPYFHTATCFSFHDSLLNVLASKTHFSMF